MELLLLPGLCRQEDLEELAVREVQEGRRVSLALRLQRSGPACRRAGRHGCWWITHQVRERELLLLGL